MSKDNYTMIELRHKGNLAVVQPIITKKHIWMTLLIFTSLISAAILVYLPEKYELTIVLVFPILIVSLYILSNPYIGVYLYFLYEFLRPYDFIPALRPLRLAMMIEILTLVSWVFYLMTRKNRIRWSKFNWIYLGFLSIIGFTVITAANNRFAYNTFQSMAVTFIMFVIATNVVDSLSRLKKLIWLLLLIALYFALSGIYNYAIFHYVDAGQQTSGFVGTGYIGDENDFALALNVMIPFAFFAVIYSRSMVKKFFILVMLAVFVFGVLCSFSRGGWLGFSAVILYCIFKSKRKLAGLGYALLLGLAITLAAPGNYWKEVETIKDIHEGTAETRINYWKAAWRMYEDHPIIGVGAMNGGIWMPKYVSGFEYPATQWGRQFHGTIPQVMAELGSLGLGCYLLMIFYIIRYLSLTKRSKLSDADTSFSEFACNSIMGGLIGYVVTATFLSTAYYPQLWTLYTLAMILVYCQSENHQVKEKLSETLISKQN